MFCAEPDKADPRANAKMNTMRTGLLPKVETRLPMKGRTAEDATV